MKFDFLKTVTTTAPDEVKVSRATGPRKARNPVKADLRLFANGAVFPSLALISALDLEFTPKDWEKQGFGFDVIDSDKFKGYFNNLPQRVIWISPVDRNDKRGKIDLFASTTYYSAKDVEEVLKEMPESTVKEGDNKSEVATQGAVTFGKKTLLPLLKDVYDVEPDEKTGFIDLVLVGSDGEVGGPAFTLPEGKPNAAYVPKMVTRGDGAEQGIATTVRRESPKFWVLAPAPQDDTATLEIEEGAEDEKQEPGEVEIHPATSALS